MGGTQGQATHLEPECAWPECGDAAGPAGEPGGCYAHPPPAAAAVAPSRSPPAAVCHAGLIKVEAIVNVVNLIDVADAKGIINLQRTLSKMSTLVISMKHLS